MPNKQKNTNSTKMKQIEENKKPYFWSKNNFSICLNKQSCSIYIENYVNIVTQPQIRHRTEAVAKR